MKVKMGFVGLGFGSAFCRHAIAHPDVEKVVAADMNDERRLKFGAEVGIETYHTMDEMLAANPDLNAVGIFVERHAHGKLILEALNHGLNVMTAVPLAVSQEEIEEILAALKRTRLVLMVAETCWYWPDAILCRDLYEKGEFGDFVFGESAYYHDISEFTSLKEKGIPPMFYSSHSMSILFGAAHDHPIDVSCFGSGDPLNAGIYGTEKTAANPWGNPFANETAIFHMSKTGIACINEYRRVGKNKPSSILSTFRGTRASYDTAGRVAVVDYGINLNEKPHCVDVSDRVNTLFYLSPETNPDRAITQTSYAYSVGFSANQPFARLPKALRDLQNAGKESGGSLVKALGHNGTHPILTDDFVRAVMANKLPPNDAWTSANFILPGLTAHESALRGGETLKVPYLGEAPADWARLDFTERTYSNEE